MIMQIEPTVQFARVVILTSERALFAREPRRMTGAILPQSRRGLDLGRSSFEANVQPQRVEDAPERAFVGCMLGLQDDGSGVCAAERGSEE
jgi:hypothetical protein